MSKVRKSKRQQSHDRFFRQMLEDPAVARDFLKTFMNPRAQADIDWNVLEVYDTAVFGENNKALYTDVVYRTKNHAKKDVFIILNHETKLDPILAIRKVEYKLGTLRKVHKNEKKPSIIYFLTWQSGGEVSANYPKSIAAYYEDAELAKKLFLEDDIIVAQDVADSVLLSSGHASVLTIFMKYASDTKFLDWLSANQEIAEKLAESKYIDRAIEYLLEVGHHKEKELNKAFTKTSEKLKDQMLTTKQQIEKRSKRQGRMEGRMEGIMEGRMEGIQTVAQNMLHQLHLGIDVVKQATGLSERELRQLVKG